MDTKKNILLIVSGSIAAYKIIDLCRLLVKSGITVTPILTKGGRQFVTPLSLSAVCEQPCREDLFDLTEEAKMGHIELARRSDAIIIAPASANIIAKIAHGLADDLASTVILASDKKLFIYPAMNPTMYANQATQHNIALLRARGVEIIDPDNGDTACGEVGVGRLVSADKIFTDIENFYQTDYKADRKLLGVKNLQGKKAVVTAGATQEKIDAVRFISNASTGRQGVQIAETLRDAGAEVTLIHGKIDVDIGRGIKAINVQTADEMLGAVQKSLPADIFVACAAVADWKVKNCQTQKIKKQYRDDKPDAPQIEFVENVDILAWVASDTAKKQNLRPPLVIGFAAESEHVIEYGKAKIRRKKCDMLIANQVGESQGFGDCANQVYFLRYDIDDDKIIEEAWDRMEKSAIALKLSQRMSDFFRR